MSNNLFNPIITDNNGTLFGQPQFPPPMLNQPPFNAMNILDIALNGGIKPQNNGMGQPQWNQPQVPGWGQPPVNPQGMNWGQ